MKKKSQLITIDYPIDLTLRTKKKLPKFKYGCPVRTKILHVFLWNKIKNKKYKQKINECHAISEYLVESVVKNKQGDEIFWIVGS
jgi:hypothetical protein